MLFESIPMEIPHSKNNKENKSLKNNTLKEGKMSEKNEILSKTFNSSDLD